jgi:HEPN domain-containing protein
VIFAADLKKIARARLADAEALFQSRRYDGSVYLCGYAVELALKYRICKTLGWTGYPGTAGEFKAYQTFRTHNLDVLLRLSGREATIKKLMFREWSAVTAWDPEARYRPIGSATKKSSEIMIQATTDLVQKI